MLRFHLECCSENTVAHKVRRYIYLFVAPELISRSEEHTSELQSHSFISYAVFCLKKKKKQYKNKNIQ